VEVSFRLVPSYVTKPPAFRRARDSDRSLLQQALINLSDNVQRTNLRRVKEWPLVQQKTTPWAVTIIQTSVVPIL